MCWLKENTRGGLYHGFQFEQRTTAFAENGAGFCGQIC